MQNNKCLNTLNTIITIFSVNNIYNIAQSANDINSLWNISFNIYRLYLRKDRQSIMSEIAKYIGQRIRNYRTKQSLSQEKLAELAGCHPTYIGQIERGEKNATLESVEKIACALNVPLSRLFEKLAGNDNMDKDIPLKCYEFLLLKSNKEQEQIYRIILEIDRYKDI